MVFKMLIDQQNAFISSESQQQMSMVEEVFTKQELSSPPKVAPPPRFVKRARNDVPKVGKKKKFKSAQELGLTF